MGKGLKFFFLLGMIAKGDANILSWNLDGRSCTVNAFYSFSPDLPEEIDTALRSFAPSLGDMAEGILLLDSDGFIVLYNSSFVRTFSLESLPLGRSFADVFVKYVSASCLASTRIFVSRMMQGSLPASLDFTLHQKAGRQDAPVFCNALLLPYITCGRLFRLCCLRVTAGADDAAGHSLPALLAQNLELRQANTQLRAENAERSAVVQALRRAESRYREIFDNANSGIFLWAPEWRLLTANVAFAEMLGYNTVNALLHSLSERPFRFCASPDSESELMTELERKGYISNFEFQLLCRDGSHLWACMHARRVSDPAGFPRYYEAFIDNISHHKFTEEKLTYQAFHDPLTGLANRALFLDRLGMALRRASRQPNYTFSVLYLDLDRFKMVNDTYGHNMGDEVLRHTSTKLLTCVREVDTVARLGGDEFAILMEEMEHYSFAVRVAKRIHTALCKPLHIRDQEISVGSSVGIVLRAERYELAEDVLRDADTAMYRAKTERRCGIRAFTRKMREDSNQSVALESDLRNGIEASEFYLEYQPVVHMGSGAPYGFEALVRWNRRGQVLAPQSFIPVAEGNGLISGLGFYVIEAACRQVVQWRQECSQPFVTHLNISGRQLLFPSFPREVQQILERTGVDPASIVFEVTENVLLEHASNCIQSIKQIRELGVQFCLDDFGSGFSSLQYLRQLPLGSIKVDRSFVADVDTDPHAQAIVRNLLSLGQDLGLLVIVGGIERKSQAEALRLAGCTLGQGFYFSRPLPLCGAGALLGAVG